MSSTPLGTISTCPEVSIVRWRWRRTQSTLLSIYCSPLRNGPVVSGIRPTGPLRALPAHMALNKQFFVSAFSACPGMNHARPTGIASPITTLPDNSVALSSVSTGLSILFARHLARKASPATPNQVFPNWQSYQHPNIKSHNFEKSSERQCYCWVHDLFSFAIPSRTVFVKFRRNPCRQARKRTRAVLWLFAQ